MLSIEAKQLTEQEIFNYLSKNDLLFNPPLSARFEIGNYSVKLNQYATHFCVHLNGNLIGFSACYFNNTKTGTGFISTFSVVKEFQRRGTGKKLLSSIVEYGSRIGFRQIGLEVHISNLPAIALYSELGFEVVKRDTCILRMVIDLQNFEQDQENIYK